MTRAALDLPAGLLSPIEARLDNGLAVRLLPDPGSPLVAYQTFFRVGSRNELLGRTGLAHLFEHLMFNGAARYGPREFDRLIESRGGRSNAYTSWDVTAYHEEAPADALDLLVDLEVDRLSALRLTDESLASEREVVKEERRQSVEDSVQGLIDEELQSLLFKSHPYRWPIIGWPGDLERLSIEYLRAFFAAAYAPSNAALWIAGGFDPDAVLAMIGRAYGPLPRGPALAEPAGDEPPQRGERRAEVRHPVQTVSMVIAFRAPPARDPSSADLDALQAILGFGDGSLLVRDLVHHRGLATEVDVDFAWRIGPGAFVVWLELPPGVRPEQAEAAVWPHLSRLADRGPEPSHLARAKSQMEVALLRELSTGAGRAHALGSGEILLGSLDAARGILERIRRVTPRSAKAAAAATFRRDAACVVVARP